MKKLLIPLLLCLAVSCHMEGTYYAENMQDIITVAEENQLVSDNGIIYTLQTGTSIPNWMEGERYYIVFDILNRDLEIRLKSAHLMHIMEAAPAPEEPVAAHDPVQFAFNQVGSKYMDLILAYSKADGSNYAHNFSVYYTVNNADGQLNLFLYHDGNDENLSKMESKDLKQDNYLLSIPINRWTNLTEITLTCDVLVQDTATGEYEVVRRTFSNTRLYD